MYGHDRGLLDTRRLVLKRAGFKVCISANVAEVEQVIGTENPDLLILCHSVPLEDCEHIFTISRRIRPQMARLVLTAFRTSCPEELAEEVMNSQDGPAALVKSVTKVLDRTFALRRRQH